MPGAQTNCCTRIVNNVVCDATKPFPWLKPAHSYLGCGGAKALKGGGQRSGGWGNVGVGYVLETALGSFRFRCQVGIRKGFELFSNSTALAWILTAYRPSPSMSVLMRIAIFSIAVGGAAATSCSAGSQLQCPNAVDDGTAACAPCLNGTYSNATLMAVFSIVQHARQQTSTVSVTVTLVERCFWMLAPFLVRFSLPRLPFQKTSVVATHAIAAAAIGATWEQPL